MKSIRTIVRSDPELKRNRSPDWRVLERNFAKLSSLSSNYLGANLPSTFKVPKVGPAILRKRRLYEYTGLPCSFEGIVHEKFYGRVTTRLLQRCKVNSTAFHYESKLVHHRILKSLL